MQTSSPSVVASEWLAQFEVALKSGDRTHLRALFRDDAGWRDILSFTGEFGSINNVDAFVDVLTARQPTVKATRFALATGRTPPRLLRRAGVETLEALFEFASPLGKHEGTVRLVRDDERGRWLAWTLATAFVEIEGHPEYVEDYKPRGYENLRDFGGDNWLDRRKRTVEFADREPDVLIIGAGQAGLASAARLGQLGIDTLVVDRAPRIGDNWRRRYHALTLHNETWVNHLPYMPFPPTWPTYLPKDKLAGWFEAYAESMELNVWNDTDFTDATFDDDARWTAVLKTGGERRVVRPKHLVFATGIFGIPRIPDLPGLKGFNGTVVHSSKFENGSAWSGKRALVIGTGNSGHDVAQDLHAHEVSVTIAQRGPNQIVSMESASKFGFPLYQEGIPVDDCDLLALSFPSDVFRTVHKMATKAIKVIDGDFNAKLEKVGFAIDYGEDDTGYQYSFLRRGGGYYLNVGCAELILNGDIELINARQIEKIVPEGAVIDGSTRPYDLIVLATGYLSQKEFVRSKLGDAMAEKVGEVWGIDEKGELRNMWKRTAQPGLWFAGGGFTPCRIYSKFLALQIKLQELESVLHN